MAGDIIMQALQHYPGANPSNLWAFPMPQMAQPMGQPLLRENVPVPRAVDTDQQRVAPMPDDAPQQLDIEMDDVRDLPLLFLKRPVSREPIVRLSSTVLETSRWVNSTRSNCPPRQYKP